VAEEEEEEIAKVPAKPSVPAELAPRKSRETGQPRIYYRITSAGYAAPKDLITDPIIALYHYPREMRSARAKA